MSSTLPTDPAERKAIPVATGFIDYFPDAMAAVAELSKIGNEQHNPGKPLHWDRSKSGDESDAMMRHFLQRGTLDTDGIRHSAKVAWRAMAMLQKEIEQASPDVKGGNAVDTGLTLKFSDNEGKLLHKSELKEGLPVKVYDRYRFAIPLKGVIQQLSQSNDGVRVKLLESNSVKYPIGCDVWVDKHQLFGSS